MIISGTGDFAYTFELNRLADRLPEASGMTASPTVGLLYPGEMGASFGKLLTTAGLRVVTTLAGRGNQTIQRSSQAGIKALPSLADVVRQSSLVFSSVETSAAAQVARSYVQLAHLAPPGTIYIDANSIGPESARSIGDMITANGCEFVDGAFNGLAANLAAGGTLFLSGRRADEVEKLLGRILRVRVLGPEIGAASSMKMLLGGLTKGICALFFELATMAHERGVLGQMTETCTLIYPGITSLIERMLPTYARHAGRRSAEMRELEQTIENTGFEPCVIAAVRELHDRLATIPFDPSDGTGVAPLVQRTIAAGLLAAAEAPTSPKPKVA